MEENEIVWTCGDKVLVGNVIDVAFSGNAIKVDVECKGNAYLLHMELNDDGTFQGKWGWSPGSRIGRTQESGNFNGHVLEETPRSVILAGTWFEDKELWQMDAVFLRPYHHRKEHRQEAARAKRL